MGVRVGNGIVVVHELRHLVQVLLVWSVRCGVGGRELGVLGIV